MKLCGIYCIKNIITNQYYIGQSVDIRKRWNQHKSELSRNIHCNIYLQRAWNKYGEENFSFQLLKACKKRYLNRFEKLYIKKYKSFSNGYNLTIGGDFNPALLKDVCDKISMSMQGDKNHFFNKKHSLISEIKMSIAHNTSGYFRVSKEYGCSYKNGFRWRYQYYDGENKKAIKSTDINKLKNKVISMQLPWIEFKPKMV